MVKTARTRIVALCAKHAKPTLGISVGSSLEVELTVSTLCGSHEDKSGFRRR